MDTAAQQAIDNSTKDPSRETVLILRTCKVGRTSHSNFHWPESGYVEAPDWQPTKGCGHGLHGWLRGEGDASLGYQDEEGALGQVVETYADHVIDLDARSNYPFGWVIYTGNLKIAAKMVSDKYPGGQVIHGTATAGNYGTATAGYKGTATAGNYGTATAGNYGTATAGDEGTATAGNYGTATAGYKGTATAGDEGTATAGNKGTATAGYKGTATAGNYGTATAGDEGTATAGEEGMLLIRRWNGKRYRYEMANVGENGIEANVAYRLDDDGNFIKA